MATFRIPISNGLLTPEHKRAIGPAVWEFLWLIDHTTREYEGPDGELWGEVNGGREVSLARIAADLGDPRQTIKNHVQRLLSAGYIQAARGRHGCIYRVAKSKRGFPDRSKMTHQAPDRSVMTHLRPDRSPETHQEIQIGQKWTADRSKMVTLKDPPPTPAPQTPRSPPPPMTIQGHLNAPAGARGNGSAGAHKRSKKADRAGGRSPKAEGFTHVSELTKAELAAAKRRLERAAEGS